MERYLTSIRVLIVVTECVHANRPLPNQVYRHLLFNRLSRDDDELDVCSPDFPSSFNPITNPSFPALHLPPRHPPPPLRRLPNVVPHRIPAPLLHHQLPHSRSANPPPIRLLPRSLHPHHIISTSDYPLVSPIMEAWWSSE